MGLSHRGMLTGTLNVPRIIDITPDEQQSMYNAGILPAMVAGRINNE